MSLEPLNVEVEFHGQEVEMLEEVHSMIGGGSYAETIKMLALESARLLAAPRA